MTRGNNDCHSNAITEITINHLELSNKNEIRWSLFKNTGKTTNF